MANIFERFDLANRKMLQVYKKKIGCKTLNLVSDKVSRETLWFTSLKRKVKNRCTNYYSTILSIFCNIRKGRCGYCERKLADCITCHKGRKRMCDKD